MIAEAATPPDLEAGSPACRLRTSISMMIITSGRTVYRFAHFLGPEALSSNKNGGAEAPPSWRFR